MGRMVLSFIILFLLASLKTACQPLKISRDAVLPAVRGFRLLPQNFYSEHLTFFCRTEVAWQRKLPFGLFVRLGSKEEVDRLEGKFLSQPSALQRGDKGAKYFGAAPGHLRPQR